MKFISQGAEAKIFEKDNKIIKERIAKRYRISQLDESLRKKRTRREAKVLQKLPKEIKSPELISYDDKSMKIIMEYIDGKKVRDVLDKNPDLAKQIGKKIAMMHDAGIIHGDLTTSNMILKGKDVYFIDFGLSFFSTKDEHMAVDLQLFKRALISRHHKIFQKAFDTALKSYSKQKKDSKIILKRLQKVESRGRHKQKS